MKWTKTNPTKVGYYWFKNGLTYHPIVLHVTKTGKGFWWADGDCEVSFEFEGGVKAERGVFWAGPIEEPK